MPSANETELQIQTKNGKIFSPIRQKWLEETPEERVRQEYLLVLVSEYGFQLAQIAEEMEVTGRGSGHARATSSSGVQRKTRQTARTHWWSSSASRTT